MYTFMELFLITAAIYFSQLPNTSSHLHPLQVVNCDNNSRFVVDEDDSS